MGVTSNIRIEPVNVTWGAYQVQTVTATADVASSHNNDYFVLKNAKDAITYHVWLNVGGAGVDPAPGGSTAIPVAVAVNASATVVAAAIAAAVNSVGHFIAASSGAVVTITNSQEGLSTTVAAGVGLVGFAYALVTAGSADDLGFIDGDIEVTFEEQKLDITAHQTGVDVLTALRQGKTASIKIVLKETHTSNMQLAFSQAGSFYTPGGGTQVVGWGTATNSQNVIGQARKLIFHPVSSASNDYSRDLAFWRAYLTPESISFSGENPLTVSCSFQVFTDVNKKTEVDLFVYGDHTQIFDR